MENQKDKKMQSGLWQYVIGFVFAIILTLVAYVATVQHWLEGVALILVIMGLAAVQFVVQLVFFLHFGKAGQRWQSAAFWFMLIVLVVIVAGSLWIMQGLNYNMMTSEQMNEYMLKESEKGF